MYHLVDFFCVHQEEKELTDMEVSLHRTRSLLGEKVIRLRHLEQSLQRATMNPSTNTTTDQNKPAGEDTTLSDLSSHSASSGISSTEFATAENLMLGKGVIRGEHFQESSEIIQSLENLNSEIREIWEVLYKQQQQSGGVTAGEFFFGGVGVVFIGGGLKSLQLSVKITPNSPLFNHHKNNPPTNWQQLPPLLFLSVLFHSLTTTSLAVSFRLPLTIRLLRMAHVGRHCRHQCTISTTLHTDTGGPFAQLSATGGAGECARAEHNGDTARYDTGGDHHAGGEDEEFEALVEAGGGGEWHGGR